MQINQNNALCMACTGERTCARRYAVRPDNGRELFGALLLCRRHGEDRQRERVSEVEIPSVPPKSRLPDYPTVTRGPASKHFIIKYCNKRGPRVPGQAQVERSTCLLILSRRDGERLERVSGFRQRPHRNLLSTTLLMPALCKWS